MLRHSADWELITEGGTLARRDQGVGEEEFIVMMRRQMHHSVKRKLLRTISETETLHEFAGMSGLKAILDEVDDVKLQLGVVQSSLAAIAAKLYEPPYVDRFIACEREEGGGDRLDLSIFSDDVL